MWCTRCSADRDQGPYCNQCGGRVTLRCLGFDGPSPCNKKLEPESKFCMKCGTKVPQTTTCLLCAKTLFDKDKYCSTCGHNNPGQAKRPPDTSTGATSSPSPKKPKLNECNVKPEWHVSTTPSPTKPIKDQYKLKFVWTNKTATGYAKVTLAKGGGMKKGYLPREATYTDIRKHMLRLYSLPRTTPAALVDTNGQCYPHTISCWDIVKSTDDKEPTVTLQTDMDLTPFRPAAGTSTSTDDSSVQVVQIHMKH